MAKVQCPQCGARIEHAPTDDRTSCQYCQHVFDVAEIVPQVPVRTPPEPQPRRSSALAFVALLIAAAAAGGFWLMWKAPSVPTPVPTPMPVPTPVPTPVPAPVQTIASIDAGAPLADVVLTFGAKGTGPGQMDRPKWITVGPDGTIWTVDLPSRVQAFDAKGNWLRTFLPTTTNVGHGPLEDDIVHIQGIAVDHDEHVWITLGYELLELSAKDGALLKKIPMKRPQQCLRHLSIDAADTLYATSNCAKEDVHGIFVIAASTGSILRRFAEPDNFEKATDWKIGLDARGNLYCPHSEEPKVVVLDRDGKLVRSFASGEAQHVGNVAVDGAGRVFVRGFDGIDVFDDQLRPLGILRPPAGTAYDVAIGPEGDLYLLTVESQVVRMHWCAQ